MDLSIIIVSWNTRDLLAQCLASIYTSSLTYSFDVWVVDNASDDGSAQMLRDEFPQVHLLANDENVGFARANNRAIRQSTGRYVLLLNPDTVVSLDAFQGLVHFMETHAGAGAAGPMLLNPDGSLQPSCHPAPTLSRELWRLFHLDSIRPYGIYRMDAWDTHRPRDVDVVQGACLLLRRSILDQIGLLDERYYIYSEEVDLCTRIQRAGWRLYWVPTAAVVHYGGQSTKQVALEMFLHLYRSKVLYFRRHYTRPTVWLYKLILAGSAVVRLALSPLARLEREPHRQQHLTLATYYRHLLLKVAHF